MPPGVSTELILILSVGFVEDLDSTLDSTDSFHPSSYAECIDILYTTNTIYIFPNDFIIHSYQECSFPNVLPVSPLSKCVGRSALSDGKSTPSNGNILFTGP